jgi:hypothetical protein
LPVDITMSRRKKLQILLPLVIILFVGAYAWHRHTAAKVDKMGAIDSREAREVSGITASVLNKDVFYVHNDSGDTSRFFAITPYGKLLSTITYNWGANSYIYQHDCEDIATGPGPVKGKSYVYIGDIGDNAYVRPYITIYRVPEQISFATEKEVHAPCSPLHLKYPDGPKDAETLMIDPIDRLLYIVTKRRDSVTVYTAPLTYKRNDTVMLTKRCMLFFAGIKPFKWITAGDIAKDGQQVVLKSYQKVYYWRRKNNEPLWQTLQRQPREPYYLQEKLGEAIGFTPDGSGYYTTSEGVYATLYYYRSPGYLGL